MSRILLTALLFLSTLPAPATKNRAVWFWAASSSIYGSFSIVGTPVRETQTLQFFGHRGIKKCYGSYGIRPVSDSLAIATWNAKLDAEGIESQFLMSENNWIFPTKHASFLTKVQQRVIDFNNAQTTADKRFDALHLDIEPQALGSLPGDLADWDTLTPTQKRDHLFLLRDTYAAVRTLFVSEGMPDFPIYADLPVWFDNLPTDGGSVGWTDAAERDTWFDDIASHLTGISLMPFERDNFSSINNGVSWERANFTGQVRIGLETDIGAGATWPTSPDFDNMMQTLESNYGTDEATDIQSYANWRQELITEAIGSITIKLTPIPGTKQADLGFDTVQDKTYAIYQSFDLCNWQEILRHRAITSGPMTHPVQLNTAARCFWRGVGFTPQE